VERAAAVVSRALEAAPSWYIALSGGKDSTCVLNLVRALAPSIRANFSQRQWDLPETLEYLAGVPSLDRVSYNAHAGREWLPNWESRDEAQAAGVRWLSGEEIKTRGSSEAVVFLGLRADENRYRREHLRKFGSLYYCEATNQWHCNPIAEWSALDVWAYICAGDIPYSAAYDVMERIGVPLEQQRVGPFGFALNAGSLAIIKRGWPEFYNQLAAQHPEARSYA
jgi:phosphoadenosine phosphosulfate reductase